MSSAATSQLGAKLGCNRPVVTLDRRLRVSFLKNNACPTGNSPDNAFAPEGDHDTPNLAPMAATLRAPVRAALASSSRARIVTRHSSRCPRAVSGSSAGGPPSNVEVITFDLDDTLWPTTPVVMAANKAFVDFCQERIPGFPDCAGINEYMKVSATRRTQSHVARLHPTHVESSPIVCITHPSPVLTTRRPYEPNAKLARRNSASATSRSPSPRFASPRASARRASSACRSPTPSESRREVSPFILIYTRAIRLTS